jgi:CRP-like cAMP-binding protein
MPSRFPPQIDQFPLFVGRSQKEIEALLAGAEEKTLKHREVLYQVGDLAAGFAVVVQGALKLVKSTPDGNDIIVFFATPGDIIGALLMNQPRAVYPVSAVSMGNSVVLKVPKETYKQNWLANPSVQSAVSGLLFSRMHLMHDQKTLSKASLSVKIAHQLINLIEKYSGENETILPVPLTRQEIADSVGASVESVIRVMSEWSHSGIIKTTDQLIEVRRADELLKLIKSV